MSVRELKRSFYYILPQKIQSKDQYIKVIVGYILYVGLYRIFRYLNHYYIK